MDLGARGGGYNQNESYKMECLSQTGCCHASNIAILYHNIAILIGRLL